MKMQITLLTIMFTFSIIMTQLNHPLSMGIMLMLQTLISCLFISLMMESSWLSYILFLVFLGGMLVLFIYTTSLAPNEMFKMNLKMIIMFTYMITAWLILSFIIDPILMSSKMMLPDTTTMWKFNVVTPSIKFYNESMMYIMITLIVYLFITLIAVVKITNLSFGPLKMTK